MDALNFLEKIRSPDGNSMAEADLIFITYCLKASKGLQLLEDILNIYERMRPVAQLQARVVVCSSLSLQVFDEFVVSKGAVGFLALPASEESLINCCIKHGLLASD